MNNHSSLPALATLALSATAIPASAVSLILLDPSEVAIPPGDHRDQYELALSATPANPMVTLRMQYASGSFEGDHDILSTHFLFAESQVKSITASIDTPTNYDALVEFNDPITSVPATFSPAFLAVHGEFEGLASPDYIWTATYLDGSQRQATGGIIPEPTSLLLAAIGLIGLSLRRTRQK